MKKLKKMTPILLMVLLYGCTVTGNIELNQKGYFLALSKANVIKNIPFNYQAKKTVACSRG